MKTTKLILAAGSLLAFLAAGCSPDDPPATALSITQPTGPAALAQYVAIGDATTAGFMDAGLEQAGQLSSYPLQIAQRRSPSPPFVQPLIAWPGVGSTALPIPEDVAGVLRWDGTTITLAGITPQENVPGLLLAAAYPTPYQNLAVPGATLADVTEAVDSTTSQQPQNRYFDLILRNPTFGDVVMLDQAIAQGPTLVTVWLGLSEPTGAAMSGQPALGENLAPAAVMAGQLQGVLEGLRDGVQARFGRVPNLVVGTVPTITALPFFLPKALFDAIVGVAYPTVEDDVAYVLFPWLGQVQGGFSDPLPASATLTTTETALLAAVVDGYNAAIADLAVSHGFTVADIALAWSTLPAPALTHFVLLLGEGLDVEQAAATTLYSLDGLHLNNRGHSVAANVFLDAINTELGLEGDQALAPVAMAVWDPTHPAP